MTDQQPAADESEQKRYTQRYRSRAVALVIRETDKMRTGIAAELIDVSAGGLRVLLETELNVGEQLKVRLKNEIERFEKEVRGIVRRATPTEDGRFDCGVELYTRLTPLEVSLARVNTDSDVDDGPKWV